MPEPIDIGVAADGIICQNLPEHPDGEETRMVAAEVGRMCPECGRMAGHPDEEIPYADPPYDETGLSHTDPESCDASHEGFRDQYGWTFCPVCGTTLAQDREITDRERLVGIMAMIDTIDRSFNRLGSDQAMSVGPVLADLDKWRRDLTTRAKGYAIVPESTSPADLRNEAYRTVDVILRRTGGDE